MKTSVFVGVKLRLVIEDAKVGIEVNKIQWRTGLNDPEKRQSVLISDLDAVATRFVDTTIRALGGWSPNR